MRSTALLALLTIVSLGGCGPALQGTIDRDDLHAIVERDIVRFDDGLPEPMIERLTGHRVLVVVPASGETLIRGRVRRFDVGHESPRNELFRVMQGVAGGVPAFLPLDDEAFETERVVVNYLPQLIVGPPRAAFDGFVLLPEVRHVGR